MSGALATIPMMGRPYDPADITEKYADAMVRGAQTGLIGQQAIGAYVQNQRALQYLNLIQQAAGAMGYGTGPMIGSPPGGVGAPEPMIGAPPPGPVAAPGAGAPFLGATAAAPAGGAGGGAPGAVGESPTLMPHQAAALLPQTSPYSHAGPGGVPVPSIFAAMALYQQDPFKAFEGLYGMRARAITQNLGAAYDQRTWREGLANLYGNGWLSGDDYQHLVADQQNWQANQQALLNSVANPDEYAKNQIDAAKSGFRVVGGVVQPDMGAIAAGAAKAGAEGWATAGPKIAVERGKPMVLGPTQRVEMLPLGANGIPAAGGGAAVPAAATGVVPAAAGGPPAAGGRAGGGGPTLPAPSGQPMSGDEWAWRSGMTEGARAAPFGRQAPTSERAPSTASGAQQFLDGTWLGVMARHHPDMIRGMTREEILSLRNNDALSNQAALELAGDNAPIIASAGLPVNATTLKLAHIFGASGATRILNAPPNTPMSALFPRGPKAETNAVLAANPQFAGLTNTQLYNNVFRNFGDAPVNLGDAYQGPWNQGGVAAAGAPAQPAGGAPAPATAAAPAVTPAPTPVMAPPPGELGGGAPQAAAPTPVVTPAGGITIPAAMTPGEEQQQKNVSNQIADYQKELLAKTQAAAISNTRMDQARLETQGWTSGPGAPTVMELSSAWDYLARSVNNVLGKDVFDPSESVGKWQAFNKNMLEATRVLVRETSARAAVQEFNMIRQANPTDQMSPQGMRSIMDTVQGTNDWYQIKGEAAGRLKTTNPLTFDTWWNQNITPGALILHRMSVPDAQHLRASMMQTPEGRAMWNDWKQQLNFLDNAHLLSPSMVGLPVGPQNAPRGQLPY